MLFKALVGQIYNSTVFQRISFAVAKCFVKVFAGFALPLVLPMTTCLVRTSSWTYMPPTAVCRILPMPMRVAACNAGEELHQILRAPTLSLKSFCGKLHTYAALCPQRARARSSAPPELEQFQGGKASAFRCMQTPSKIFHGKAQICTVLAQVGSWPYAIPFLRAVEKSSFRPSNAQNFAFSVPSSSNICSICLSFDFVVPLASTVYFSLQGHSDELPMSSSSRPSKSPVFRLQPNFGSCTSDNYGSHFARPQTSKSSMWWTNTMPVTLPWYTHASIWQRVKENCVRSNF